MDGEEILMSDFSILDRELSLSQPGFLEASAGTGKTFCVEQLVLRLLVEPDPPCHIDRIGLVTFTRAAARELRMRIRSALEQGLSLLDSDGEGVDYLSALCKAGERERVRRAWSDALLLFEEAPIGTIHGFCQQMLSEHPLESKMPLFAPVATTEAQLAIIRTLLLTPSLKLSPKALKSLLARSRGDQEQLLHILLRQKDPSLPSYAERLASFCRAMEELVHQEKISGRELLAEVVAALPHYRTTTNRRGEIKEELLESWSAFVSLFDREGWDESCYECAMEQAKEPLALWQGTLSLRARIETPPSTPLLDRVGRALLPLLESSASPSSQIALLQADTAPLLQNLLQERGALSYEGLLEGMVHALDHPAFFSALQGRFDALICDEFQDTDRLQWEIFSRLFGPTHRPDFPFWVVGDPKQSIYSFRSADLYTYMEAKKSFPEERRFTLTVNWRAQPRLVSALNQLFGEELAGSWLHLPHHSERFSAPEVHAGKKEEGSLSPTAPLRLLRSKAEEDLLHFTLHEIRALQREDSTLLLSDIALLLRDRHQIERVRALFRQEGIPTSLEGGERVAGTPLLLAFQAFCQLLDSPRDPYLWRRVLFGPLIQSSPETALPLLEEVIPLYLAFEPTLRAWKERGFLAALYTFLDRPLTEEEGVGATLLRRAGGARLLDEFLQLAEALAERIALEGWDWRRAQEEIARWGVTHGEDEGLPPIWPAPGQEGVKVMTIHASKGLEFPVCFAWGVIVEPPRKERGDSREEEAERLRLFYVAATRASQRLYLPLLPSDLPRENSPLAAYLRQVKGGEEGLLKGVGEEVALIDLTQPLPPASPLASPPSSPAPPLPPLFSWKGRARMRQSFTSLNQPSLSSLHRGEEDGLPSGAAFGQLLHTCLERLPLSLLQQAPTPEELLPSLAPLSPLDLAANQIIATLFWRAFHTPLAGGFTLAEVDPKRMWREVPFFYKVDQGGLLDPGMVTGSIDLLFLHQEKLYFVDWKSNRLADYTPAGLHHAVEEEGYLLQASLYAQALQRHLSSLKSGWSFGGAFYIFLRAFREGGNGVLTLRSEECCAEEETIRRS